MMYVGGLVTHFLFSESFMVAMGGFCMVDFACEALALREGLLQLGSYDSILLKEEFSPIIDYMANC